jgi:hypothetical protein
MFGTSRPPNLKNLFWFLGYLSIVYLVTVLCAPRSPGTHSVLLWAQTSAPSEGAREQGNRSRIKNLFSDPLKGWDGKGPRPTANAPALLTPQGSETPSVSAEPSPSPVPSELPSTEGSVNPTHPQGRVPPRDGRRDALCRSGHRLQYPETR